MNLNKTQILLILGSIVLFGVIYFGMNTKPKEQLAQEKSRAVNIEATGIQNIVMDAKRTLTAEEINIVEAMQTEEQESTGDIQIEKSKLLASKWYELGHPIVSGYYAEKIAEKVNDKNSWSMAGTTYMIGLKNAKEEKEQSFAKGRAIEAFEKAISLEENNVSDQINLALLYVDYPENGPMQGIQMLLKLNESYPDNVQVINQLARLGLRTNQVDKAIARLEKALTLDPSNNNSICLIAQAYEMAGRIEEAKEYGNKCKK